MTSLCRATIKIIISNTVRELKHFFEFRFLHTNYVTDIIFFYIKDSVVSWIIGTVHMQYKLNPIPDEHVLNAYASVAVLEPLIRALSIIFEPSWKPLNFVPLAQELKQEF